MDLTGSEHCEHVKYVVLQSYQISRSACYFQLSKWFFHGGNDTWHSMEMVILDTQTSNDIQRHLVLANGYTIATPLKCRPSSAFCFLYIISDDVVLGCFCNTALQIFKFPPLVNKNCWISRTVMFLTIFLANCWQIPGKLQTLAFEAHVSKRHGHAFRHWIKALMNVFRLGKNLGGTMRHWSPVASRFGKSPNQAARSFSFISTIFNDVQLFQLKSDFFFDSYRLQSSICHFSNFFRMATLSFADGIAQGMVIASATLHITDMIVGYCRTSQVQEK